MADTVIVCDECGGHALTTLTPDQVVPAPCDLTDDCPGTVYVAPEYDPDSPNHEAGWVTHAHECPDCDYTTAAPGTCPNDGRTLVPMNPMPVKEDA